MAKSTTFWVVGAVVGVAGLCCLTSMGVMALGLTGEDVSTPPTISVPSASALPTGETPTLFPGSTGWLPSGRGVPIPEAEVVDGHPQGLWWVPLTNERGQARALTTLFLADGTRASNPRPGGGLLFDLEGQRAQPGSHNGLGTWELDGDTFTQRYDGFVNSGELDSGSDSAGPWFSIGKARYRPLTPPTPELLAGSWSSGGGHYVFHDDGTFESGHVTDTGDFVAAVGGRGTWQLDGYLISIRTENGGAWIDRVGMTGEDLLVLGSVLYGRK